MGEKENEALVRRGIEAWNANDWELLESLNAPEIEIVAPKEWPEGGTFTGWAAVRGQFERLKESWSEEQVEIREIDAAGDKVYLASRWIGKGEASGLDLDLEIWIVYTVRRGKFARIQYFLDGAEARGAAGLENEVTKK